MIDISAKITNKLPAVKISDDLIITVNNRKSNMLAVRAMVTESQKVEESGGEADELKLMDSVLRTLTNAKTVDEINKLDLPLPEYKLIFNAVQAACSGQTVEEFEEEQKRFQK